MGPDWPTDELRDVFHAYHLRVLARDRMRSGPAPWWTHSKCVADNEMLYDSDAIWTETQYLLRRDLTCESCGNRFGYNFEVMQISRMHHMGRGTDGSLRRELSKQLRRRIHCPSCRALQKEPRSTLLRSEHRQTLTACSVVVLGFLLFALFGGLGGWLGGVVGFFVGLMLAVVCMLGLWSFAFPHILGMGPTI